MSNQDGRPKKLKPFSPEIRIFGILFLYFVVVTPIYIYATHGKEMAGTFALALTAVMFLLITVYLVAIARKIDVRPEDNPEGEIYQGAGELGFFPPQSIFPFWCALSLAIFILGPVFGWWLCFIGFGLGMWAVSGWAFEFYRGRYAH